MCVWTIHLRLVEYADEESAQKAIRELDGMKLLGRAVRVREVGWTKILQFSGGHLL